MNKKFILAILLVLISCNILYSSAEFFNKLASNEDMKPDKVIKVLNIKKTDHIADIGAGGGYYVYRFAKIASKGIVYAVDINDDYLNYIRKSVKKQGLKNVIVIQGKENNPGLKKNSVDLIFLRTVYHHIENRVRYFNKLKSVLKKGGRIVIIDNLPTSNSDDFITRYGHYSLKKTILSEMKKAGFNLKKEYTFIPGQSFFIFTP